MSDEQDGDAGGVYVSLFAADGSAQSLELRVNTRTTGDQHNPSVAMDADGDLVVAWESRDQDGNSGGIYARRFASDGTPAGDEIPVNTYTTANQSSPAVSLDTDGDFVVAWVSRDQDGSLYGVYARRFSADGTPLGPEIPVDTYTTSYQLEPSVSLDADGDFVVVWKSQDQDGGGDGIYAQRFRGPGCYGEPLEAACFNVAAGARQDCVSYTVISAHDLLVEPGGELIFTAPTIGLGPGTIVETGGVLKAGP